MNALLVLMGLLVLSYLGSFFVTARSSRGVVGLPSGAEYVALGFILGPHVLGVVDRSMLEAFEPIAHVAVGWLALLLGLDFGFAGDSRVRKGSLGLALIGTLLTGGAVFVAVFALRRRFPNLAPNTNPWLLATAIAAASAETTRHGIAWVTERYGARGPISTLLSEIGHADEILPLIALAAIFALTADAVHIPVHVPAWSGLVLTVALGLVLGGLAAVLIGYEFTLHATWGVLFGISLLAIGVAARFELSPLGTTFFIGMGIAAVSPHRALLREVVGPTERPVLLPVLLIAGARIDLQAFLSNRGLVLLVFAALCARVVGKLLSGGVLYSLTRTARMSTPFIGLGLLSSGALSVFIGLALAIRFPGPVGDSALLVAALAALLGELVAPLTLRRVLSRAGETEDTPLARAATIAPRSSS